MQAIGNDDRYLGVYYVKHCHLPYYHPKTGPALSHYHIHITDTRDKVNRSIEHILTLLKGWAWWGFLGERAAVVVVLAVPIRYHLALLADYALSHCHIHVTDTRDKSQSIIEHILTLLAVVVFESDT